MSLLDREIGWNELSTTQWWERERANCWSHSQLHDSETSSLADTDLLPSVLKRSLAKNGTNHSEAGGRSLERRLPDPPSIFSKKYRAEAHGLHELSPNTNTPTRWSSNWNIFIPPSPRPRRLHRTLSANTATSTSETPKGSRNLPRLHYRYLLADGGTGPANQLFGTTGSCLSSQDVDGLKVVG